jgi:uncharacterized phiE125 gp8 family phage protein
MSRRRYTAGLTTLTPPVFEPVTLDELRANSRIDADHTPLLQQLIAAARQWVEKNTDTTLATTTLRWTLDRFPRCQNWLYLPRWPVQSVEAVTYQAPDGTSATISGGSLRLLPDEGRARLALADWAAWPSTRCTPGAIQIDFLAGYGEGLCPELWKQPILMLASHWFENPEAAVTGTTSTEVGLAVRSLIESLSDYDDDADQDWGE